MAATSSDSTGPISTSTWRATLVPLVLLLLVLAVLYGDCVTATGQAATRHETMARGAGYWAVTSDSTRPSGTNNSASSETINLTPGRAKATAESASPCPSPPPSPSPAPAAVVVPDLSSRSEPVLPDVAKAVLELDLQGKGKRVIAMSLFGTDARYVEGAVDNALLARRDWPGWTYRIYHGDNVPDEVLDILRAFHTELIKVGAKQERATSTLWRYYAAVDPTVSRFIARDIDARLSHRDKAAVDEWVASRLPFHTMHDHHAHVQPILGGMWGAVGALINPGFMLPLIENSTGAAWGVVQDWLQERLWPLVRNHTLDHSSYSCGDFHAADNRGFPMARENAEDLVGNVHAPPTYLGIPNSGPCPERCRRDPAWTVC